MVVTFCMEDSECARIKVSYATHLFVSGGGKNPLLHPGQTHFRVPAAGAQNSPGGPQKARLGIPFSRPICDVQGCLPNGSGRPPVGPFERAPARPEPVAQNFD